MRYLILAACLLIGGCGPDCVKGHDETNLIPAHVESETTYINLGGTMFPMTHDVKVPERHEKQFVCDQYGK